MKLYFDIGANRGEYTDSLINTMEFDKIISVEANPHMIGFLKNRFSNNTRVEILNNAVSTEVGKVDFYVCGNCDVISTCDMSWINESRFAGNDSWTKIEVDAISIDYMIEKYGVPVHIKIDVEGYELNVIKGMTKNYGSQISFEWAEEKLQDIQEIIKYLESLGYCKFGYILGDKYDDCPSHFYDVDNFILKIIDICDVKRKLNWGMIFADSSRTI